MKSTISWLDPRKILLVESVGLWEAESLLIDTQTSLAKNPDYIIWNPIQIMFPNEYTLPLDKISSTRRLILDLLAEALLSQKLRLLVIIGKKDQISFKTLSSYSEQMNIAHLVKFVPSIQVAQDLIAVHQVEFIK